MSNPVDINLQIVAVSQGIDSAKAQVDALSGSLNAMPEANNIAGAAALSQASKQTTLHEVLGASRRETALLEQTVLSAAGANSILGQSVQALMTGIGPVGIVITGASLALQEYTKWLGVSAKAELDAAEAANKYGAARANSLANAADAQALKETNTAIDETAKQLAQLKASIATPAISEYMGMSSAQISGTQAAITATDEKLKALVRTRDDLNSKAMLDSKYANQMVTFTEQTQAATGSLLDLYDAVAAVNRAAGGNRSELALMTATAPPGSMTPAEETAFYADQLSRRTTAQAKLDSLAERAQTKAVSDANAAQAAYEAQFKAYESMASAMLKTSTVTQDDLNAAAGGTYKDKDDENIRRARSVVIAPTLDNENIKLMPAAIQSQLKEAFASGGAEGLKLKAADLVAQGENFSNPAMWDVKKMAADLKAAVVAGENKLKLADMIVKESGLDPNDALVKKNVGTLTGTSAGGDLGGMKTQGVQSGDALNAGIGAEMAKFKPSSFIAIAFAADVKAVIDQGARLGASILQGIYDKAKDADFANAFAKLLIPTLAQAFALRGSGTGFNP